MNKKLISTLIGMSVVFGCNPGTAEETVGSSSGVNTTSGFESSGNGQSQTSISEQVTTSGSPNESSFTSSETNSNTLNSTSTTAFTDSIDSDISDTSTNDTIIMTISTSSICGDEIIEFPEECDDGNPIEEDDCSNDCFRPRLAFQSFQLIPSNFGGILIADQMCQENAFRVGLTGVYKAWVSDNDPNTAPKFRFNSQDFKGWYQLPTNPPSLLAKGWNGLTTEDILHWIDVLASGEQSILTPEFAWTGTKQDGSFIQESNCVNWTSNNGFDTAIVGTIGAFDSDWTELEHHVCMENVNRKIYCFQVE